MLKKTEKITEKLAIMKMIREVSDEFPKTVWASNYYGSQMNIIENEKSVIKWPAIRNKMTEKRSETIRAF